MTLTGSVTSAAWVEHGGDAGPLSAALPDTTRGIDVVYVHDGVLYRVELAADPSELGPIDPGTGNGKGCGGCGSPSGGAAWLVLLATVVRRRRWQ